jgi:hypothetical protein
MKYLGVPIDEKRLRLNHSGPTGEKLEKSFVVGMGRTCQLLEEPIFSIPLSKAYFSICYLSIKSQLGRENILT